MKLRQANKMMGIVNESVQKIIEIKEKLENKRWQDSKAQLIYGGVEVCYLEMIGMQGELEDFALSEQDGVKK